MSITHIHIVRRMRTCGRRGGVRVIRREVLILMVIRVWGNGIRLNREIGLLKLNEYFELYCIVALMYYNCSYVIHSWGDDRRLAFLFEEKVLIFQNYYNQKLKFSQGNQMFGTSIHEGEWILKASGTVLCQYHLDGNIDFSTASKLTNPRKLDRKFVTILSHWECP